MKIICSIIIFLFSVQLYGQKQLFGKISNENNEALPSVVVNVYSDQDKGLIAYSFTNDKGEYNIHIHNNEKRVKVLYTSLGYKKEERIIENFNHKHDIKMLEESFTLKEVTIKALPIKTKGDTIIYNVASFQSKSDRSIEDVLKKLPGIVVENSGQILYKGEGINKFYIEGLDMLSGRYGLATKNISADDIASISIYENHQPKKILEDIAFSNKAALNLKLKKQRTLKPVGTATVGGGYGKSSLWLAELYTLLISPKMQQLLTIKTNNFSNTYLEETSSFIDNRLNYETVASNLFSSTPFGTSKAPKERYYENHSISSTFNSLYKLNDNSNLTINGSYIRDINEYSLSKTIDYFDNDNTYILIEENNSANLNKQEGNMSIKIENNSRKLYLLNELNLKGKFESNKYNLNNNILINQNSKIKNYNIGNKFNIITRNKNKIIQFKSNISFANTPQSFIRATSPNSDSLIMNQNIEGLAFHTLESTSLQWLLGNKSSLLANLSFESYYDKLNTILNKDNSLFFNENEGYKLITTISPTYQYQSTNLKLNIELPIQLYNLRYIDLVKGEHYRLNKPYLEIRSTLNYSFKENLNMTLICGSNHTMGGIINFLTNPIYTTYRDQSTFGAGTLSVRENLYVNTSLYYRNTIEGCFFTFRGGYQSIENNTIKGSNISDNETAITNQYKKNRMNIWSLYLYAAKNLHDINTILSLIANFNLTQREAIRQDITYNIKNSNYLLKGNMKNNLFNDMLVLNLGCQYSLSTQLMDKNKRNNLNEILNVFTISFFPIKSFEIHMKSYHNLIETEKKHFKQDFYLDAGIRYINKKIEIELKANNLTNKTQYNIQQFNIYDTYSYTYYLRPIEFMLSAKYKF